MRPGGQDRASGGPGQSSPSRSSPGAPGQAGAGAQWILPLAASGQDRPPLVRPVAPERRGIVPSAQKQAEIGAETSS